MSTLQPSTLPPGFEQLSKEQQIDYVQQLWDLILAVPDEVPVPDCHLNIEQERVASQSRETLRDWQETKARLLSKCFER